MRLGYQPIDTPGTEMYHPSNGSPRTANTWGIVSAAEFAKIEILSVNKKIVKEFNLRPDIVLKIQGKIYIIDVVCPFENRLDSFERAKSEKSRKYQVLVDYFKEQNLIAEVIPIVVGALGTWDAENDRFLTKIMSRSFLKKMSKICVSENIRWARDIYVEHITGHRQFDASAIVQDPSFRPQEPPSQEEPLAVPINSPPPPCSDTLFVPPAAPCTSAGQGDTAEQLQ
ncbi:hypothetical protein AVEN_243506-1 [Araneus ventricosus]|uniref:Uncharacterized protein n=1 Tax=Araneus ventricosus TaxID=182803 RepID=A0A4Y2Q3C2_ARAVE|nr:hypothetical protein AVEN_243506-1 [Araneus ventricosus]